MAFPRLPLKVNIKNSHIRLLSPLSSKTANISTCSNAPQVNKVTKTKGLLDSDYKTDVRYRSFRNTREERKLRRSTQAQNFENMTTDNPSKSTPLFHTIEDHLQPKKIVVSTKPDNNNPFSGLYATNNADNKYVTYIQNQRPQSDITHTKKNKHDTQKSNVDDDYNNLNDIINTITENQVQYNLKRFKGSISLHSDCVKDVYDTVTSFKKQNPDYKSQSINLYKGGEIRKNIEEIINFFEDIKGRVIVNNPKAFTTESYPQKTTNSTTTDFSQSSENNQRYPKENPVTSSPATNIKQENCEYTQQESRNDPPYKSYSEVLARMVKAQTKPKIDYESKDFRRENNSPIFSQHSKGDIKSSANFSQQRASYSNHALTSARKDGRKMKTENRFSTSPTYFWVKCGKPPPTSRCDYEEEKIIEEKCRCVQPVNPECKPVCPEMPKTAPPLRRLKKVEIPQPKKVCPPPPCEDVIRADDSYKIEPKQLPRVPSGKCPCVEPFVPSRNPSLKRLAPINIPEPEKICPEEKCPPRADDSYKITSKQLPKLPPSDCPCVEPDLPTKAPRLPRLKINIPEPPRVCDPCEIEFCCPPRMDDGLKVKQKKLPPIEASPCPCVEPHVPTKAPSLKRLGPVNIIEPPKICPADECPPTMDQLLNFKVKKRKLPSLKVSVCPCIEPEIPNKAPPLKRLRKANIPEPPKVCPPPPCEDAIRADDNYKIEPKQLPRVPSGKCPCVEPFVPSRNPSLKRLAPINIPEPEKICPEEKCPPRADDSYKITSKQLPKLPPSDCPCVEPDLPTKAPRLPRLKINIPEPPRVCDSCEIEFCCPPRMDDGLKVKQKKLPPIEASPCPCVEPHVPTKAPSLKRLGPVNIIEPPKICPADECPPTMDQLLNFKVKKRKLPSLKVSVCPCIEPEIPNKAPPLKRLRKANIPEPPKVCPPPPCEEAIRADDNYKIEPKQLPVVPSGKCPCVEPFVPSRNPSLKRLAPINIPEPEKICPEEKCPPRADDSFRITAKQLPKMLPSDCPCVEPKVPSKSPSLPRLKLTIPEPPRVCDPCETEFCCPPRMDDRLKLKQKKLPPIKASACPCVETFVPSKVPSLKRLGPVNIIDPPKICPTDDCPPTMDQLANYKVTPKKLKTLILNECFNTMSTKEYNDRFPGKTHTTKRKFGTKTMFTNFLSKRYGNFYSNNSFNYDSFRYINHNHTCQPHFLSSHTNPSSSTDDEKGPVCDSEEIKKDQDFITKFATQCTSFLSDVASTLSAFESVKGKFEKKQNLQNRQNCAFLQEDIFGSNANDINCEVVVSSVPNTKLNMRQPCSFNEGLLASREKLILSNSKDYSLSLSENVKEKIRSSIRTRIAYKCGKVCKAKHQFIPRKQKITNIHTNGRQIHKTIDLSTTSSYISKKNVHKNCNEITNKSNESNDFILKHPNNGSSNSATKCDTIRSSTKQPAVKIYPTKSCKVKLNRKHNNKYLTGYKLLMEIPKYKSIRRFKDDSTQENPKISGKDHNLKNRKCYNKLERESSYEFYESFLGMIQRLVKCPVSKDAGEDEVRLKAYVILETLRKLHEFSFEEQEKQHHSSIHGQIPFQSSFSNTCINEQTLYRNHRDQNILVKCDGP